MPKARTAKTRSAPSKFLARHSFFYDFANSSAAAEAPDTTDVAGAYAVPSRIQLLPPSGFSGRDGRGPYTYSADTLLAAFEANGMPLAIDYEHQSLGAMDKVGPTPAAGWINAISFDAMGCWAEVEWTEDAADFISEREYRFISPVFEYRTGTAAITALTGAGLTNNPNLYLTALNSKSAPPKFSTELTTLNTGISAHMRAELLKLFGLAEDATDEAILASVTASQTAAHSKSADLSTYVAKTEFEAMSARATSAETQLTEIKTAAHAAEVESVVTAATTAGKLTPAQASHAKLLGAQSLDVLKDFIEAAPVQSAAQPAAHAKGAVDTSVSLTDAQKEVCRISGLPESAFAKALAKTNV